MKRLFYCRKDVILNLNQLILVIHGIVTTLSCTDAIRLFDSPYEDLTITYFTGIR